MPRFCSSVDEYLGWFSVAQGKSLVVGSNTYGVKEPRQRLYPDAVGVDINQGPGVDFIHDMEKPLNERFAHVDCCSMLEHSQRPWLVAKNLEDCLIDGGTILLLVPFAWRIHAYPSDYWRMTIDAFPILFPNIDWVDRCYLSNGRLRKIPPKLEFENAKGLERTEAVGFGVKCSAS